MAGFNEAALIENGYDYERLQLEYLFYKKLSTTHKTSKLARPSAFLEGLIEVAPRQALDLNCTPGHNIPVRVLDPELRPWTFLYKTRQTGPHPKPTISAGWLRFVRAKNLHAGDIIVFFRRHNPAAQAPFFVLLYRAA